MRRHEITAIKPIQPTTSEGANKRVKTG